MSIPKAALVLRLLTRLALVAAVLGVVAIFVVFAVEYAQMPETVPTHFGATGVPNGWGPKATLMLFPILGLVFFGVFVLLASGTLTRDKPMPPAMVPLLQLVGAESIWMFFFIESDTMRAALGRGAGLGIGFFIAFAMVLLTTLVLVGYSISWTVTASRSSR